MSEERGLQVEEKELVETEAERTRDRPVFVPRTDIYETDDAVMVVANMPGVEKDSIDISVERSILIIRGRVEPEEPEGYALAYAEYRVGDYERSFSLSSEVDQNSIEATLTDGVLCLRLPKALPMAKKIVVKTG
jgi:HSP20 family molecular chaperone IbpA